MSGVRRSRRRGVAGAVRARWATTYEKSGYRDLPWFAEGPAPPVERAVGDGFLRPGAPVLDVGCGAGSNVLFLARQRFRAFGIDLAPAAVRAAKARAAAGGLTIDVREGDALALEFDDATFGGAVDIGCFHTLPVGRRGDYAREIARVLRPGGSLLLSWVARESPGDFGPPHRPSLREVTDALERRFLFSRTEFHAAGDDRRLATYDARLLRRSTPQPPRR